MSAAERRPVDCEVFIDVEPEQESVETETPAQVNLDRLADLLRRIGELECVDVAVALAELGIPVLPTVPGDKAPLLTARHIRGVDSRGEIIAEACKSCFLAGLRPTGDHGATLKADAVRGYWAVHPDAGVGMKEHPSLVRGDGDFTDGAALRKARKLIGYGQPSDRGCPEPFEARTPGGPYRRRFLHTLPVGVPQPGGGTLVFGVSWYGGSGYVVVKGGHPSGKQYTPFIGTIITPLPDAVCDRLRRRAPAGCQSVESAASSDVATFLDTHRGTSRYGALADRRRTVAKAVEGARHHTAQTQLVLGYREAIAGYYPAQAVHDALHHALTDSGWDGARFDSEWAGMNAWAIGQVQHLTADAARSEISEALGDILTGNLDDTYPAEYVDALDADHGRELPIDELDRLIAAQDQTGATDYDDDARGVVTFRSIPEPFMVPTLDWLAKGLISHPTHGELAGPEKALKSHVGLAIDVGLAAGVDVLSQWPVPQPISVLVLVGEGGEATFLRRLDRACTGYGISIEDIRPTFRYTTQTAPVSSRPFREGLQQALDQHQPDLVHLDPWYSYAPTDTDARNLYETGAALDQIGALVRDGGASLIINNHFNQTGTGHGLRRISMAGHAEWCDSWWLLDHREPPDVTRGRFRLRLDVGSRQWGGRAFHVDFDTGRFNLDTNEHDGQMKWTVTHAAADPGTETDATKIAEGKKLIIQSWKRRRGPDRHQPLSQRAWIHRSPGVSAVHLRAAFAELLNNGRIQGIETTIEDASKRTRRGTLYQLV